MGSVAGIQCRLDMAKEVYGHMLPMNIMCLCQRFLAIQLDAVFGSNVPGSKHTRPGWTRSEVVLRCPVGLPAEPFGLFFPCTP
jgi:hypothetical protein